jgi:hypothetical protein
VSWVIEEILITSCTSETAASQEMLLTVAFRTINKRLIKNKDQNCNSSGLVRVLPRGKFGSVRVLSDLTENFGARVRFLDLLRL